MRDERGFDMDKIRGWYRQGSFVDHNSHKGTATVLFTIDHQQHVMMERFCEPLWINDPKGVPIQRKQHFAGGYKGMWWQPPTLEINDGDEMYITEGCTDAISLHLHSQHTR